MTQARYIMSSIQDPTSDDQACPVVATVPKAEGGASVPVGRQTFLACVRGQTTGLLHRRLRRLCLLIDCFLSLWDVWV